MAPHLVNRPVALPRCPTSIDGQRFFPEACLEECAARSAVPAPGLRASWCGTAERLAAAADPWAELRAAATPLQT
jgi:DNA primase